jgi:hypothetical protein
VLFFLIGLCFSIFVFTVDATFLNERLGVTTTTFSALIFGVVVFGVATFFGDLLREDCLGDVVATLGFLVATAFGRPRCFYTLNDASSIPFDQLSVF